jgi:hypothetical protein
LQLQQLKERSIQLETENADAVRKLTEAREAVAHARDEQERTIAETRGLNESLLKAQAESRRLALDMAIARTKEREANDQLQKTKTESQAQRGALDKARWEVVGNQVSGSLLSVWLSEDLHRLTDTDKDPSHFILVEAKYWPKPYEAILQAIDDASMRRADIPINFYNDLRQVVGSKQQTIRCDALDFEKMNSEYLAETKLLPALVESATEAKIASIVNDIKQKDKSEVLITDEFKSAIRRVERVSREYEVKNKYTERLSSARAACRRAATDALNGAVMLASREKAK